MISHFEIMGGGSDWVLHFSFGGKWEDSGFVFGYLSLNHRLTNCQWELGIILSSNLPAKLCCSAQLCPAGHWRLPICFRKSIQRGLYLSIWIHICAHFSELENMHASESSLCFFFIIFYRYKYTPSKSAVNQILLGHKTFFHQHPTTAAVCCTQGHLGEVYTEIPSLWLRRNLFIAKFNHRITIFSLFVSWLAPLCLNSPGALSPHFPCTDYVFTLSEVCPEGKEQGKKMLDKESRHVNPTGASLRAKTRCGKTSVGLRCDINRSHGNMPKTCFYSKQSIYSHDLFNWQVKGCLVLSLGWETHSVHVNTCSAVTGVWS